MLASFLLYKKDDFLVDGYIFCSHCWYAAIVCVFNPPNSSWIHYPLWQFLVNYQEVLVVAVVLNEVNKQGLWLQFSSCCSFHLFSPSYCLPHLAHWFGWRNCPDFSHWFQDGWNALGLNGIFGSAHWAIFRSLCASQFFGSDQYSIITSLIVSQYIISGLGPVICCTTLVPQLTTKSWFTAMH